MPQPTVSEVHNDRPLTNLSVAYMNRPDYFVADRAFPGVNVSRRSDKYYEYTAAYWFADEMARRAPNAEFAASGYGISTGTYNADIWAIARYIGAEELANADDPINLEAEAVTWLAHKALIRRERAFAADFMASSVWGTDGSPTDWDSTGVPITDVQTAQRTVQAATGYIPNRMVCGLIVYHALQTNSQITDMIKYTARALPGDLTDSLLATALGLESVLVSRASYLSTDEGETATLAPIVDDDALVIYAANAPGIMTASAGYTFFWEGGGGMGEVVSVDVPEKAARQYRIQTAFDQKLISSSLGYFFPDIV